AGRPRQNCPPAEQRVAQSAASVAQARNGRASVERENPRLAPNLRAMRTSYSELAQKRGEVREALGLYETLKDLEDRRTALELEETASAGNTPDTELPAASLDKFAVVVQHILQTWHFPNAGRVYFDQKTRDLVIGGKNRTSFGKGLRAITQSAFTI